MRIDAYTKVVLTVIAACLIWLSLGGTSLLPTVHAQATTHVLVDGWVDGKGETHQLPSYNAAVLSGVPVAVVSGGR